MDGQRQIVSYIRRHAGEAVKVDEQIKDRPANGPPPTYVTSREPSFALLLADDNSAFLGASLKPGADAAQHRKTLEKARSTTTITNGYRPPWVNTALSSVSLNVCGFVIGEIPSEWRKPLADALKLRVCPRSFVLAMQRVDNGVSLFLTLNVEREGAAQTLREDMDKTSKQAAYLLQKRFPAVNAEPEALALFNRILQILQWKTDGDRVKTEVWIPDANWKTLGKLVKRVTKP
jgi:hypothetical protein